MAAAALAPPVLDTTETRRRLEGTTVLVLGTDAQCGGLAFVSLDRVGVRVRLARRMVQAAHVLADVRADIVIVDADTVQDDPTTLVDEMRATACTANARLIALTAKDRRRHKSLAAAGFEAVIAKPLDPRRFAQELAMVMPAASDD
jgi:DNA-binding response OmpR family regulator